MNNKNTYYCHGTTVKGERCKRKVTQAGQTHCHQHSVDNLTETLKKQLIISQRPLSSYIYVYTLDKAHNNAHLYNHIKGKFETLQTKKILIKIGYTTRTPQTRLEEWKNQCQHPIRLIGPSKRTKHYDPHYLGWHVTRNNNTRGPKDLEQQIHKQLFDKFGYGYVVCHGCNAKHYEWVVLRLSDLSSVYKIIDTVLSKHLIT